VETLSKYSTLSLYETINITNDSLIHQIRDTRHAEQSNGKSAAKKGQ
jgi:hypothetical protein